MAFTLNLYSNGKFCKLEYGLETVEDAEQFMRDEVQRMPDYYTVATITRFGAPVKTINLENINNEPQ